MKKNEIELFPTLIIKYDNFITEQQRVDILNYVEKSKTKFKKKSSYF